MIVAMQLQGLATDDVVGLLQVLADHNARQYVGPRPMRPWSLRYIPDAYATRITLRDARALASRGYGSCGELAAAYAGYLASRGIGARVVVTETGLKSWHAHAVDENGVVYDPANLSTPIEVGHGMR